MTNLRIDQLPAGQPAIITAIDWSEVDAASVRRLYEMGFDEGVDVEVLHRGPVGGDPIAVRVGNMVLAMRRAQARLVSVEPISANDASPLPAFIEAAE